jgi:hypothetical protein
MKLSVQFRHLAMLSVVLAWPATAGAGGAVLESYPGVRPGDAESLLEPLMRELSDRGFSVGPDSLGNAVEGELSRSGRILSSRELSTARGLVDQGWSQWVDGDFSGAAQTLSSALELFRSAPATIARDQSQRDPMRRALVGLALANKRLGNAAEATSAMAEVVRSFPDRAIDKGTFGPEAKSFYEKVQADMKQRGKGSLRVEVDDSNAVVFVNERYITLGSTTQADLYAGRYRVYVQRGDDIGRVHVVDVEPGAEKTVSITWSLDAALHTHAFVGFEFSSNAERERNEARFATTVARATGASGVVVVSIAVVDGRRVVQGSVLLMDTATTLRRAYLPIEPVAPNATQVRALALFLAGGEATDDLVVVGAKQPTATPSAGRPYRVWKWLSLGLGTAALGTGVYLFTIHDDCSTGEPPAGGSCEEFYDTQAPAIVAASAGAVLLGTGLILWLKDEPPGERAPRRAAGVVPTRGGFVFSLSGTY